MEQPSPVKDKDKEESTAERKEHIFRMIEYFEKNKITGQLGLLIDFKDGVLKGGKQTLPF
jgi:hypothetical protein